MYKIIKAWLSKKVNKSRTTQKVYNGWDWGLLLKVKKKKKSDINSRPRTSKMGVS